MTTKDILKQLENIKVGLRDEIRKGYLPYSGASRIEALEKAIKILTKSTIKTPKKQKPRVK